jgi:hypothetical protein
VFRPSTYLEPHQIVEPGKSEKAAFDPDAYHEAMRGGRSEGMMHYLAAFLGGGISGFVLAVGVAPGLRFLIALAVGLGFAIVLHRIRLSKQNKSKADAILLHAEAHKLEMTANRLEIEKAKASGAFDRWGKS